MGTVPSPISDTQTDAVPLVEIAEDVFHGLPIGIIVFDRSLRVVHRNQAAASLFPDRPTVSEMLTSGTVEGQYQDWPTELRRVVASGRQERYDGVVYSEDRESERLLNLVCTPLRSGKTGDVIGATLVAEDTTQRASLERRLAVSERLAAVGKLAARVAHELNNPLDGILRYISLARRVVGDEGNPKVPEYLDEARQGLLRMADIIRELLSFSRSSRSPSEGDDVNRVLEEAIRTLSAQADENNVTTAARFQESEAMPRVRGSKLFQIFCNLIKNAIDAMPDGGRLTIMSGVVDREVVIRFEDTGVGLPEDASKVFEPFFTTKKAGQGTGLGLAISRDYIERLHGQITAENRPEVGAVFVIRIPVDSLATEVPDR